MGLFQDMIAGGLAAIRQAAGVTVTIRRNGIASAPVTAVRGSSEFIRESDENGSASWRTLDYLIAVADYVIDGVVTQPQGGDLIEEAIGGIVATSEVVLNPGEKPTLSDSGETQYRIHTQRVAAEDSE